MTFDVPRHPRAVPDPGPPVHGKPLVYLDNAASAQKPEAGDRRDGATRCEHSYANVHRGLHTLANETTDAYEAARRACARFINARAPNEIVFTKGGTEAINLVASASALSIKPGDEIVRLGDGAPRQHRALALPARAQGRGAEVAPITATTARSTWTAFDGLLGPRTKIVALTHMSNVLGTVNPVAETRSRHGARGRRRWCCSTAARRVVHERVDVQALDVDFYVVHRPQALRPHRHRRALRQARAAGGAAALPRAAAR